MTDAKVSMASFIDANLEHANCQNGDFQRVDFKKATLDNVDFSGANLSSANFADPSTKIHKTIFAGAILEKAQGHPDLKGKFEQCGVNTSKDGPMRGF